MSLVSQNFYYFDKDTAETLAEINKKLSTILANQESFRMSFEDEMQSIRDSQAATAASLDVANGHLDAIKGDVQGLMDTIANFPAGGLTPDQAAVLAEIRDGAKVIADRASGLAAKSGDVDALKS